ncbi:MAG: hypothetical protein WC579_01545 [Candidatus Paceibacterota bacterium]
MRYCGYGWYEMTENEEAELGEFYDNPEKWLYDYRIFDDEIRYDEWCEWFSELRYQKPEERLSWKEFLIKRFLRVAEKYIIKPIFSHAALRDAGRLGQN